jgi:ElaB/YqjD/DUF883 family membrane-anchored ribosome-binding protein
MASQSAGAAAGSAESREEIEVDMSTIRADMDNLRRDLARLRENLSSYGSAKAGEARETAEARLSDLQQEFDRLVTDLRLQGRDAAARVERNIHERPFTALALAVGVGLLLAQFLGRR